MSDVLTVSPRKVQFLRADKADADVGDIFDNPTVVIDPASRSVSVSTNGREEKGNIQGDLIASKRGLKITCGSDGEELRSIHMVFEEPDDLDSVAQDLESAGLTVVRSQDDPEYRTQS
ncbi:MAG TPA: hypothetical protein VJ927_04975 [Actinomycetota bacterium]|nr:hypothetical protein [Actinomycetota bacterium]